MARKLSSHWRPGRGLFVTSTETGVGKTVVSSLICASLSDAGYSVGYFKPVQTGGVLKSGKLISPDQAFLDRVMEKRTGFGSRAGYVFKEPASPHYAAKLEGASVRLSAIKSAFLEMQQKSDFVVVEGAGGIHVPLDGKGTLVADIPSLLGLDSVIVSRAGLGCINAAGLTASFMSGKGLRIAALILVSDAPRFTALEKENARILARLTGIRDIRLMKAVKGLDTEHGKKAGLEKAVSGFGDVRRWFR